jgi:Protein of unknown function (DUF3987)
MSSLSATDALLLNRFIPSNGVGPPVPLEEKTPPPAFPVEVLPEPVRWFVEGAAQALGCPVDFLALPALVVAGAALGNTWRLSITPTHQEHAALFGLIVGPPGSGKSPALALTLAPLRAIEECHLDSHRAEQARWLVLEESRRGPVAPVRRCLFDHFKPSTLGAILEANPRGILVARDDLGSLIRDLTQSRDGKGHEGRELLQLWSGTDLLVDRKEQVFVRRPFVALVGGIQTSLVERLRERRRGGFVSEDGFLDRFLVACPELPPVRGEESGALSGDACRAWYEVIECLAGVAVEPEAMGEQMVRLSESGWEAWERFTQSLADEQQEDDFPPSLRGTWAKLRSHGGRLALVLHALLWAADGGEGEFPALVEGSTVDRAVRLINYFKGQAQRLHGYLGSDPAQAGARQILRWLGRHPEAVSFTRRDLHQSLRKTFPRAVALDAPLRLLLEHGYLSASRAGATVEYHVNPLW